MIWWAQNLLSSWETFWQTPGNLQSIFFLLIHSRFYLSIAIWPRGKLPIQTWNSSVNNRHCSSQKGPFFWNFKNPFLQWVFSFTDTSFFSFSDKRGHVMCFVSYWLWLWVTRKKNQSQQLPPHSPHKPLCVADSSLKLFVSSCNC